MDGQKIIKFLHVKYEGDWEKIYKAIESKEKIEETEDAVSDAISEYEMAHGVSLIGLVDSFYPKRLQEVYKPMFVLEAKVQSRTVKTLLEDKGLTFDGSKPGFSGAATLIDNATITLMEDIKESIIKNSRLFCAYIDIDEKDKCAWLVFNQGKLKSGGSCGEIFRLRFKSAFEAMKRGAQICNQVLFVTGATGMSEVIPIALAVGATLFAIPGPSGCKNNKLIKEGIAKFCDCISDLTAADKKAEDASDE